MSQISELISSLPTIPSPDSVPLSPEDHKRLTRMLTLCNSEIYSITVGIAAIGNVFSDLAQQIQDEETINIGQLLAVLAGAVDGLREIESKVGSVLDAHEKAGGEQ
ncbi:MAG: hypothetical protein K1563_07825 [Candidatus Thiodiazotropha sp. (ex. Lucinisca nassula)]|nr:hypothetical protein [Candidatus Thiodiazotropha sp. (ex. Lucinisca nassula)]MBW9273582.1 hypothetical protein [Candidatus Thiodiazotropha sp. (ex. Lucinisca nassula)]